MIPPLCIMMVRHPRSSACCMLWVTMNVVRFPFSTNLRVSLITCAADLGSSTAVCSSRTRAFGRFKPALDGWTRKDGRFVDPFRPRVHPDGFATALELQYDTGGGWTNAAGAVGDTDAKTITWNSPFGGTQALQVRARVVHRGKVWDGTQNVDAAANPNVGWSAPVAPLSYTHLTLPTHHHG